MAVVVDVVQITEDLKVVATISEQRQKIRAHELLERREQLQQVCQSSLPAIIHGRSKSSDTSYCEIRTPHYSVPKESAFVTSIT